MVYNYISEMLGVRDMDSADLTDQGKSALHPNTIISERYINEFRCYRVILCQKYHVDCDKIV